MTDPVHPDDLTRWLDRATQGLPSQVASTTRAELAAHFEDSVADLVQQGVPEDTASQRALAALGDPQPVAHRLNDVHRGRLHYIAAMLVSLAVIVLLFSSYEMIGALGLSENSTAYQIVDLIYETIYIVLITYVLVEFRRLLLWRFDCRAIHLPVKIMLGGFVMTLVGYMILEMIIDSWDPIPTLWDASSVFEALGFVGLHGGLMVVGAGVFLGGVRIWSIPNGILKTIAVLAILLGVGMDLNVTLLYVGRPSYPLNESLLLIMGVLWPAIALAFFQAIYAHSRLPMRAA
jgi:hypothetical protein